MHAKDVAVVAIPVMSVLHLMAYVIIASMHLSNQIPCLIAIAASTTDKQIGGLMALSLS